MKCKIHYDHDNCKPRVCNDNNNSDYVSKEGANYTLKEQDKHKMLFLFIIFMRNDMKRFLTSKLSFSNFFWNYLIIAMSVIMMIILKMLVIMIMTRK